MKTRVSIILLLTVFLFSCKKEITKSAVESTEIISPEFSISKTGDPTLTQTASTFGVMGGTDDYLLHFEDKFNGNFDVAIFTVGPPRHIYQWQILRDGLVVLSSQGNVSIYNQTSTNRSYEYLGTLNNPISGNYMVRVWFNAFFTGSGWQFFSPTGTETVDSDVTTIQTTTAPIVNIYLYWSHSASDHVYLTEKTFIKDWIYEKIEFTAYSTPGGGKVPVYRYWSLSQPDHMYLTTVGSYQGYIYEKIAFYVYPTQVSGTRPVYQYWSLSGTDHFYTVTPGNFPGYVSEGILGYVPN